jgi:hypothetical protein
MIFCRLTTNLNLLIGDVAKIPKKELKCEDKHLFTIKLNLRLGAGNTPIGLVSEVQKYLFLIVFPESSEYLETKANFSLQKFLCGGHEIFLFAKMGKLILGFHRFFLHWIIN